MINDATDTAGCFPHCLRHSRETWNAWVMSNNRSHIVNCDTWTIIRYFDYCWVFICSCRWSWCWWFCFTSWRILRSIGDEVLFANCISVEVLKASVVSPVCTRHSRDALWWSKSHFDLRLPNLLELLKLLCRILNGLEGSHTGSISPPWGRMGVSTFGGNH